MLVAPTRRRMVMARRRLAIYAAGLAYMAIIPCDYQVTLPSGAAGEGGDGM